MTRRVLPLAIFVLLARPTVTIFVLPAHPKVPIFVLLAHPTFCAEEEALVMLPRPKRAALATILRPPNQSQTTSSLTTVANFNFL